LKTESPLFSKESRAGITRLGEGLCILSTVF